MAHKKHGKWDDIHETPDVHHITNEDVAHEESDVNVRGITTFVAGLVALIVISMILMRLMYNVFDAISIRMEKERAPSSIAMQQYEKPAPEPRLQMAPGWGVNLDNGDRHDFTVKTAKGEYYGPDTERIELMESWREALKGGKNNPETKFTTLPIDQAMQQVVSDGLPVRTAPTDQTKTQNQQIDVHGLDMPTDTSSGRQTEKRYQ